MSGCLSAVIRQVADRKASETQPTPAHREPVSWWVLRAEVCTSETAAVRSHSGASPDGKIQYPLAFPVSQETL